MLRAEVPDFWSVGQSVRLADVYFRGRLLIGDKDGFCKELLYWKVCAEHSTRRETKITQSETSCPPFLSRDVPHLQRHNVRNQQVSLVSSVPAGEQTKESGIVWPPLPVP